MWPARNGALNCHLHCAGGGDGGCYSWDLRRRSVSGGVGSLWAAYDCFRLPVCLSEAVRQSVQSSARDGFSRAIFHRRAFWLRVFI